MLSCLVVRIFHVVFLLLAGKLRLSTEATSIVAEQSGNLALIEGRGLRQSNFSMRPCALVLVPYMHNNGRSPV